MATLSPAFRVVSPLQDGNQASTPADVRDLQHDPGELAVSLVVHLKTADRIFNPGVESGRNQGQVWLKLLCRRKEVVSERSNDLRVSCAGRKGPVHGESSTGTLTGLVDCSRIWIERRLVGAHEKDRSILVERVLGAVSMMYVPVGDEYPFCPVSLLGVARRDSDIVEEAEAHSPFRRRVVAWRANRAERVLGLSVHDPVHGSDDSPHAGQSSGVTGRGDVGVPRGQPGGPRLAFLSH